MGLKKLKANLEEASKGRVEQLHEMEEFHLSAYESSTLYDERMKKWHDANILKREFRAGNMSFLYNSRLKLFPGKLKSKWFGPFCVIRAFPYGAIEVENHKGSRFKVNGQRLKLYFGNGPGISIIEVIYLDDA